MTDDHTEICKRTHRFSIQEFYKNKSSWETHIFQLEQKCRELNKDMFVSCSMAYVGHICKFSKINSI